MDFETLLPENSQLRVLFNRMYEGVYFVDNERKILFWSKGAERITGYTADKVQGFHCYDNILVHVDEKGANLCQSGCPLSKAIRTSEECDAEAYLHHLDGYRVPVKMHVLPVKNEAGKVIGAFEIFTENLSQLALAERMRDLQKEALLDSLTEIGNRRYFETHLFGKLKEAERYETQFGMLFIDIDFFKSINDAYGHTVGDKILVMVAKTLHNNIRPFDIVSRWGGEEFAVLIDKIHKDQLLERAESLRMLVEQSALFADNGKINVTISIGATMSQQSDTVETIVKRADLLMYRGKQLGRNRVIVG